MAMNGVDAQLATTTINQRRIGMLISRIIIRLLIAFIISWMIIMAFFVSGVVSH